MSEYHIEVRLSDAYRKAQMISNGVMPAETATLAFEAGDMFPEQREVLADWFGTRLDGKLVKPGRTAPLETFDAVPTLTDVLARIAHLQAEQRAERSKRLSDALHESTTRLRGNIERHDPEMGGGWSGHMTPEQADEAEALGLDVAEWRSLYAEIQAHAAEWRCAAAEQKAKAERLAREAEERREQEAANRKAAWEADKAAWVLAHGSPHLQRACAGGYDCARLYVKERAAQEAPDFVVDFDDTAEWKARSCPSEAALDLADTVAQLGDVTVVWLTTPARSKLDADYAYDFEACEAVAVRNYLGKYDLVALV